ncbi:hypothetical protein VTI74DRAFT_5809 [Chaetomium olivicolor]
MCCHGLRHTEDQMLLLLLPSILVRDGFRTPPCSLTANPPPPLSAHLSDIKPTAYPAIGVAVTAVPVPAWSCDHQRKGVAGGDGRASRPKAAPGSLVHTSCLEEGNLQHPAGATLDGPFVWSLLPAGRASGVISGGNAPRAVRPFLVCQPPSRLPSALPTVRAMCPFRFTL